MTIPRPHSIQPSAPLWKFILPFIAVILIFIPSVASARVRAPISTDSAGEFVMGIVLLFALSLGAGFVWSKIKGATSTAIQEHREATFGNSENDFKYYAQDCYNNAIRVGKALDIRFYYLAGYTSALCDAHLKAEPAEEKLSCLERARKQFSSLNPLIEQAKQENKAFNFAIYSLVFLEKTGEIFPDIARNFSLLPYNDTLKEWYVDGYMASAKEEKYIPLEEMKKILELRLAKVE